MELVVRALRCPPPDQPQAIHARFGAGGGRIGRSDTCALILPSPDRYISREHLEIRCRDGRYSLKVISQVNGCSVNDSPVPPGAAVELFHGDRIQLGDYLLVAELQAGAGAQDPLAAFGDAAHARAADSLDRMASLAPAPAAGNARFDTSPHWALPTRPAEIPVDRAPAPGRDDGGADALDAFLGRGGEPMAPAPLSGPAQGLYRQQDVHLAMPAQGHNTLPAPAEDDIFAVLDRDFGLAAPTAPAAAAPTASAAGGATADDGRQALAVLAQALGLVPGELDAAHPTETIRLAGELLNLAVDGLYQMLAMRAQLKRELRVEERTMIASRENNPLKHSDSARDALRYLLDLRQHGNKLFLPPNKAVADAVDDVCAHEMAMMAGTRAALLAALKMFSPDTVEKRIKKSGALDSVVPALHKAKLWESFLAMYGELEKEAEDHFDRLLNQEFARAYAEQGRKLRHGK